MDIFSGRCAFCQRNISKQKKKKKHQEKHMPKMIGQQLVRAYVYSFISDDTLTQNFFQKLFHLWLKHFQ